MNKFGDKKYNDLERILTKVGNCTEVLEERGDISDWAKNYWGTTRERLKREFKSVESESDQKWIQVVRLIY